MLGSRSPSTDIATNIQLQVINVSGEDHIIVESHVGANNYRKKMGSKTKMYHVNMLKKYIAREHKVDVVHTSIKDDATIAVAITQSSGKYQT